ncbi:MAG: hypothetical protein FWH04_05800 [Oscillospiraceae bacterium]|nr:hypothetical protein [Oscillospiraceae bacterium]
MRKPPKFDPALLDRDTERREIGKSVHMLSIVSIGGYRPAGEDILLAVERKNAPEILSKRAIAEGYEDGGWLYYSAPYHFMIPLFELLRDRVITDEEIISRFDTQELFCDGQYFYPEYFGALGSAEPHWNAEVAQQIQIGVFDVFQYQDGSIEFAIHQTAAHYELSEAAQRFAEKHGVHLHYTNTTCAIPVFELTAAYPRLRKLFASDGKGLEYIVAKNFPEYAAARGYKSHREE